MPESQSTSRSNQVPHHAPGDAPVAAPPPGRKRRRKLFAMGGVVLVAMVVFAGVSLVGAEYYTARPQFCGSCHIMDPYFASWTHDKHGAQFGVRCVDCHYAPGERHTIMAKFRGLSQVTSYFSGRAGSSRPRAQVSDSSCTSSGCHGDGSHLSKSLPIGQERIETRIVAGHETQVKRSPTVHFVHEKHLKVDEELGKVQKKIDELTGRFHGALTAEEFEQVSRAVTSIRPAATRETDLADVMRKLGRERLAADGAEWMQLEHHKIRLLQLNGLHCSSCHTYDQSGQHHLAVDQVACFTCHFGNQAFNRDTGECIKCHEPPTRQIVVHGGTASQRSEPVLMDHRDIIARGIDCASCHLDVTQGESSVTARDCTHCHDQQHFFEKFDSRTTVVVEEYHRIHVAGQRARCVDCHRPITHHLIDPMQVATSANVLKPVVDDCQHCHPGHHREQVNLLMGIGGAGIEQPVPNAMFGSRMNCRACHTQSGSDFKGDPLVRATQQTCVACHNSDYEKLFDQWVNEMAAYLKEAEAALARLEQRVEEIKTAGGEIPSDVARAISEARQNIGLIRAGNGIHNKSYAMQLLDLTVRDLDRAIIAMLPHN